MRAIYILPILALLVFGALSSIFIVDERQKVLVLQFGQVKQVKETPGLGFKIPFLQDVVAYDDRILALPTPPLEVTMDDDRRLVVDAFARWKIVELIKFRESVGAGGIEKAQLLLAGILNNAIPEVLGKVASNRRSEERRVGKECCR